MSTVVQTLGPRDAKPPASNFARYASVAGTNNVVEYLRFVVNEECTFRLDAVRYGSGNVTVKLRWNSPDQTTGNVKFEASVQARTPNTDSQDVETDAFDTAASASDAHLGTTAKREHEFAVTVTALDGLAADDSIELKIKRIAADSSEMTGDCRVMEVRIEYSDV